MHCRSSVSGLVSIYRKRDLPSVVIAQRREVLGVDEQVRDLSIDSDRLLVLGGAL